MKKSMNFVVTLPEFGSRSSTIGCTNSMLSFPYLSNGHNNATSLGPGRTKSMNIYKALSSVPVLEQALLKCCYYFREGAFTLRKYNMPTVDSKEARNEI